MQYSITSSFVEQGGAREIYAVGDNNELESTESTTTTTTIIAVTIVSIFTVLFVLIVSLWYFYHKRSKRYLFNTIPDGEDEDEDESQAKIIDNGDGIKFTTIGGNVELDEEDGNATRVIVNDSVDIDIIYDKDESEKNEMFNPNQHQTEGNNIDDENMTLNSS